MKRTGIFFHYHDGQRLRDFPQALEGILDKDNVFLYDAFYPSKPPSAFDLEPIPEELPEKQAIIGRRSVFAGGPDCQSGSQLAQKEREIAVCSRRGRTSSSGSGVDR